MGYIVQNNLQPEGTKLIIHVIQRSGYITNNNKNI